jgi:histidinol-phosphatase (PHP family)
MPIYGDYHLHTPLCHHATGPLEAYIERACALGLRAIGFSDHNPLLHNLNSVARMAESELDYYIERVTDLRFRYRGQIEVLLGLELDYLEHLEGYLHRQVESHPWDYIIGAVHNLDADCREFAWSTDAVAADPHRHYRRYFDLVGRLARSGLCDIIAHFDVPKRSGTLPDKPMHIETLEAIARAGVVLEINTSGYRHPELPSPQPYPSLEIVERAYRLGIPLMVNSDAHAPEQVGLRFAEMEQFLHRIGCRQLVRFEARQPIAYAF